MCKPKNVRINAKEFLTSSEFINDLNFLNYLLLFLFLIMEPLIVNIWIKIVVHGGKIRAKNKMIRVVAKENKEKDKEQDRRGIK